MLDSPRFANGFEDFSPRSFIKMVSGKNITVGSNVWVEDNELAWIEAEVLHVFEEEVKVITRKGKRLHMPLCKVHPRDPATENGIEDMTRLYYLSEPEVLCNLAKRYEQNNIYTYSGKILIAINPFTQLPQLYNLDMMDKYRRATFGQLSPHVFAVADSAYRAMISKKHSQSILVSGESGAGKTETTKLIMQYLAYIGGSSRADNRRVEQQILKSNTLLEAFGNARTTRNNNSSRFGKFVQIQFDKSGRISGAAIRTYLLERSRVVQIAKPERNYHCFYQLCTSPEASQKYKLGDPKTLHYLNNSNTYGLSEISDADDYIGTRNAMHVVGIGFSEQEAIFQTLAGILHLGNIEFCCGKENDSSMPKDMDSCFHLQCAAELLGCDAKQLEDTLCRHGIVSPEGVIIKELDSSTAATNRDALAKTIYIRLFEWLVAKINASIGQDTNSKFQIGVLDIYGFESFENNSFEQFCINFANEKLQQHFNLHVFKMEQENYSKEHIDWSHISFVDNQDVVDLIEKKHSGIIAFLDDCCKFPKSTSQTLASKLYHAFKDHDRFRMRTESLTKFTILHYAGEVIYQMDNFLEKNKDYVVLEHHNLLSTSKCSFVAGLFLPTVLDTSKSSFKFSSVASQFKEQLQALVNTLSCTEPHYVRCVKPNSDNKPWEFDNLSVLHQLRCGGVLEAIRISCAGYPTRCTYDKFLDRFGFLAPEITNGCYDTKIATEKLLQKYNIQNYQLGRSMVFLRAAQMAELDCQRSEMLNGASRLIQCRWQTFVARKIFLRIYEAAICIQAFSRGCLARRFCESRRRERGAILMQKNSRRYLQRRTYIWLCSAAVSIQSAMRSSLCQKQFYQKKVSAIAIQKTWRMRKSLAIYHKLCASSITLQCAWRQLVAKRRLQRLKAVQSSITLQCAWRQLVAKRKLQTLKAVHTQEFEKLEMMKLHNALHDIREQLDVAVLNFSKEQEKTQIIQSLLESTLMERKHRFQTNLEKIFNLKKQNEDLKALAASLHRKKVEFEIELKKSRAIFDEWQKRK